MPEEERYCVACNELLEPHAENSDGETLETEWLCVNAKCERYGRV